jgi:polysaccharide chain length determinant protein (PEP-CTERM system associated)
MLTTNRTDGRTGQSAGAEPLLDLWMRRKWIALLVFGVVAVASVTVALSLPDLYKASATVLVETRHVSEEFVRSSVSSELETRIQTIREEVMSRGRLGDIITRLDLYPAQRAKGVAFDVIIEKMRHDVDLELDTVAPTGGRTPMIAFTLKYSGRDPQRVAQVANLLANLYILENSKIREGQAVRTAEFLKAQLDDVKRDLDAQERRASEFNLSHIGELPQQVSANLASLERLNTQLRLNGENQVRVMDRRERLEKQLTDTPAGVFTAGGATSSRASSADEVARLKLQLEQLARKYTDQYPEVIRVRAELADLERKISAERPVATGGPAVPGGRVAAPIADSRTRVQQAIADADAEMRALKKEEVEFRRTIDHYEQRVENVPKRQEEFQALSRDADTIKERYNSLLKRYEEAQLAASLEQGQKVEQFRILDAAIPPREPAAPSRVRLFAMGFFLALALAAGTVFLLEKIDTAFHSVDDLRAFVTVPALFSIPLILTPEDTRRRWRQVALIVVSIGIGLALVVSGSHHVARDNEQLVRLTAGARG